MTAFVILADDAHATAVSRLAAMGHVVRKAGDVTRAQLAAARKVIVVWSRSARGTPALKAAARQAKARGKLVCVRLDAALPPAELGGKRAVRMPPGHMQGAAWRRLLSPVRRPIAAPAHAVRVKPTTRHAVRRRMSAPSSPARAMETDAAPRQGARLLASLVALALIVVAAGAEAYARDAEFAARLQAFASDATAAASQAVADIRR